MIPMSAELKAEFEKGTFCALVRITTELGKVFGYTDYPVQLTYDGTAFVPGPDLVRLRNYQTSASQSNNQKVQIARIGDFTEDELESGMFDNAIVEVMRVVPEKLNLGHFLISKENIAATKWDELSLNFDILDMFRGLNVTVGTQNSPTCRHTFGDTFGPSKMGACTLNANNYTSTLSVTAVNKAKMEFTVSSSVADGYYSNGNIIWTLGNNASGENTIKTHKIVGGVHTLTLFIPQTFNIQVGDQLKIVVGCDGTFETCNSKFGNGRNFGGNPLLNPGVTQR